jgi:tetratricopeptide (TPR) repeat protein
MRRTSLRAARHILLAAALGGCAYIPYQGDVDARVDALLAEEEYGRALQTLAYVRDDDPRYQHFVSRHREIRRLADQYARRVMSQADALVREGRWGEALELYREAVNRLPRHTKLREHLQAFRAKQAERIKALELEKLIAEGQWLRTAISIQESITEVAPGDWSYNSTLDNLRYDAERVAERLTERGLAAMENNDLGTAGRTLPLAAQLNPTPRIAQARKKLSAAESHEMQRKRQARQRARKLEQERRAGALRVSFEQARSDGDLVRARDILKRLLSLAGKDPEDRRMAESFDKQLDSVVQQKLDEGALLYSQGRIEEAMARWRDVLELDPDHEEAKANLERAQRVAQRVQQLREKQAVPTAAPIN